MSESIFKVDRTAKIYEPVAIVKTNHHIEIGKNCTIGQFCFIAAKEFIMEECAELSPHVVIGGGGNVHIGYGATVNYGAQIIPATFATCGKYMNDNVNPKETASIHGSIVIGKGAYIGSNAVICVSQKQPHIEIGKFAVIGANSYIDKDVPPGVIVHPKIKYTIQKQRTNGDKFIRDFIKSATQRGTMK